MQSVCQETCRPVTLSTSLHTHQPFVYDTKYSWRHITKPRTHICSLILLSSFCFWTLIILHFTLFLFFFRRRRPLSLPSGSRQWACVLHNFIRKTEGLDYQPAYTEGDVMENEQDDKKVRQTEHQIRRTET
jgi:hypothetical protein